MRSSQRGRVFTATQGGVDTDLKLPSSARYKTVAKGEPFGSQLQIKYYSSVFPHIFTSFFQTLKVISNESFGAEYYLIPLSYYYEEDFKRHSQQCRNKSKFKCPDCGLSSSLLKVGIKLVNIMRHVFYSGVD